jgi:hypothetical protein
LLSSLNIISCGSRYGTKTSPSSRYNVMLWEVVLFIVIDCTKQAEAYFMTDKEDRDASVFSDVRPPDTEFVM